MVTPEHRPTAAVLNFIYLSIGHAFYKLTALLTIIVLARWLGGVEFGRYLIALAAAQLASYLTDLGIDQAVVHDAAGRPHRLALDVVALLLLRGALVFVLVALSAVLVLLARVDPDLLEVTLYLGVAQSLAALTVTARSIFQAFERMEYEAISVALEGWLRLGAVAFAVGAGFGILEIAKSLALASLVVFTATLAVVLHRFVRPSLDLRITRIWGFVATGVPFWLVWSLLLSDQRANLLLLARMSGDREVAAFGGAMRLVEPTLIIPTVLALALFPVAVRHSRERVSSYGLVLLSTQKTLLLIGLPLMISFVIGAPLIVRVVLGTDFVAAEGPMRVLAFALVLLFVRIGLAQVLLAAGRWRSALVAQGAGLVVDLIIAFALIPVMAELGAAVAALVGNVVAVGASWLAIRDRVESGTWPELGRALVPAAAAGVVGLPIAGLSLEGALIAALTTYVLGMRVVRVFSARDAAYLRTRVPRVLPFISFAIAEEK